MNNRNHRIIGNTVLSYVLLKFKVSCSAKQNCLVYITGLSKFSKWWSLNKKDPRTTILLIPKSKVQTCCLWEVFIGSRIKFEEYRNPYYNNHMTFVLIWTAQRRDVLHYHSSLKLKEVWFPSGSITLCIVNIKISVLRSHLATWRKNMAQASTEFCYMYQVWNWLQKYVAIHHNRNMHGLLHEEH